MIISKKLERKVERRKVNGKARIIMSIVKRKGRRRKLKRKEEEGKERKLKRGAKEGERRKLKGKEKEGKGREARRRKLKRNAK